MFKDIGEKITTVEKLHEIIGGKTNDYFREIIRFVDTESFQPGLSILDPASGKRYNYSIELAQDYKNSIGE